MRLCNKQQLMILIIGVVLTGGFLLLQYFPTCKKINLIKQANLQRQSAITKAAAEVRQLPRLADEVENLKLEVGNFDGKIPSSRKLGVFIQQIADAMNTNNLKEQMVQFGDETKLELQDIDCVPVSIQCRGRLAQIFGFFKSLEQLERVVRIERVRLQNDADLNGQVCMQLEAAIYYKTDRGV